MKKLILIVTLLFAVSMQANAINQKIDDKESSFKQLKNEYYTPSPEDICEWDAAVYVANHTYNSQTDKDAARQGYYDGCMDNICQ